MRYVLIVIVAAAGWLGYQKYKATQQPEPAPVEDPNRTPGANAENRMNNLSGAAPAAF